MSLRVNVTNFLLGGWGSWILQSYFWSAKFLRRRPKALSAMMGLGSTTPLVGLYLVGNTKSN